MPLSLSLSDEIFWGQILESTVLCLHTFASPIRLASCLAKRQNLVCSYPSCRLRNLRSHSPGSRPAAGSKKSPNPEDVETSRPRCFHCLQDLRVVLETWVVLYPGSRPARIPHPNMPVAWFQICFRCGQDAPRTVPCPPQLFFPLSVFAYRFCDRDRSTSYAQKSTGSHPMLGQSVSIKGNAPSLYWSWPSLARLGAAATWGQAWFGVSSTCRLSTRLTVYFFFLFTCICT